MTLSPSPPFPWGRGQLGQGWLEAARPHPVLSSRTRSFLQVKLWRLPAPDGLLPSGPGLVLGPEDVQVEVLQFHPTADGILVSAAGRTVKVWFRGRAFTDGPGDPAGQRHQGNLR